MTLAFFRGKKGALELAWFTTVVPGKAIPDEFVRAAIPQRVAAVPRVSVSSGFIAWARGTLQATHQLEGALAP